MRRNLVLPLSALFILAACGGDAADAGAADSSNLSLEIDAPRNPRVMAIDIGRAADSTGRITGGSGQSFPEANSLYVSVRTQYVAADAQLSVRLTRGSETIDSVSIGAGAPVDDIGTAVAELTQEGGLAPGVYQVEVFMADVSQGIREVTIGG